MLVVLVLTSGLSAGFLSGLVGLGGGILLAPLLLFVPDLVGLGDLSVKEVTGLTMVQGLAGALSGVIRHHSYGYVSKGLVAYMGVSVGVTALLGALLSSQLVSDKAILVVFATMALVASLLIFLPGTREHQDRSAPAIITFNLPLTVLLAAAIGFSGGLVGQAGSFILIPAMVYVLHIPTRYAIGSNLGIILLGCVDISSEPYESTDEVQESQETR